MVTMEDAMPLSTKFSCKGDMHLYFSVVHSTLENKSLVVSLICSRFATYQVTTYIIRNIQ